MLTRQTRPRYQTLLDAAALQAEAPDAPAVIYLQTDHPPVTLSRGDFRRRVRQAARALAAAGIGPGDLLIIAHTQNLESILLFWAAIEAGAIPSMFPTLTEKLDPDIYLRGMSELARLSGAAAVLTTDEFAPVLRPRLGCPVYGSSAIDHTGEAAESPTPGEQRPPDPAAVAFLQHSSGTTGLQKGVALSHAAALNQIAAYSESIALSAQDVVVSWLPLYHDMGLIAGFLLPLIQGVPLVLMSPFDWVQHPALLFRAIDAHGGTLCWLPNFAYNHLARRVRGRDVEGLSAASMRLFVNCSEPVRHDSHRLFLERFGPAGSSPLGIRPEMLGVSYAMAENTFAVTQTPPGRPARLDVVSRSALEGEAVARAAAPDAPDAQTRVSCGPPIPGTEVAVIDAAGRPLPDRAVGEIAIRSDCLLTGYYRRPDLNPFTADGWYRTGDRGYLAEGELFVVGRTKDLIINAGKNIYPQDIEAVVNHVAGVHAGRAVVFGVPDEREGTELIAVVAEVRTTDEDERRAIGRAIRQEVARQTMVSVSYVELVGPKWLIKTSSGKIARAANREKWLAGRAAQQPEG